MANNVNNVVVGKPLVTGGILVAQPTVTLPTDATVGLATGFNALGYITDNGVTKSEKRNTGVLYAWGGDTIAATKKGMDVTFKLQMAEFLNPAVQQLVYGTAYVSSAAATIALGVVPTVTTAAPTTGGTFTAGQYVYAGSWITADGGESKPSAVTAPVTVTANQEVPITFNATPTGASGWNLYRSPDGGITWYLVKAGGTGTSYTDLGGAGALASLPYEDTTGKGNRMTVQGTSANTPKMAWVFEVFSDPARVRIVVPAARVMDVGDTIFKDDSVAVADVTLQAFPVNGRYFYAYTDDGSAVVY